MGALCTKETVKKVNEQNPELVYRVMNLKSLRTSLTALYTSIVEAELAMQSMANKMTNVGKSYTQVTACLNHGDVGNLNLTREAAQDSATATSKREPASSLIGSTRRTRINREEAKSNYESAQSFTNSMNTLKTDEYRTYKERVDKDVQEKIMAVITKIDVALPLGKKAGEAIAAQSAAAAEVEKIENRAAITGKDMTTDPKYSPALAKRERAIKGVETSLQKFDSAYEEVMPEAQVMVQESMDFFLDPTVDFTKALLTSIDRVGPMSTTKRKAPASNEKE